MNGAPVRAIRRVDDAGDLAREAAALLIEGMDDAIRRDRRFNVALSGGRTPREMYELLATRAGGAARSAAWQRTFVFTVDERRVPPDHPDSNFRLLRRTLTKPLGVPPHHVVRFLAESADPEVAAAGMEEGLRRHFEAAEGEIPRFDLIVLGMGEDGHTASLFPGCDAMAERRRLAMPTFVPALNDIRFTMTPPVLNAARQVIFLVSGASKAETLREVLAGPHQPERLPAQIVAPTDGEVIWLVDAAAASRLGPTDRGV